MSWLNDLRWLPKERNGWNVVICPVCQEETTGLLTDDGAPMSCGCAIGLPHFFEPAADRPRQGVIFS